MKKSLLALAVLGAFAGTAMAQSSVTIYGKLDQGVGKPIGTKDKQVRDAAGSRIGFRGVEDLGGGLAAVFGFEHRFSPDTGCDATSACGGQIGTGVTGPTGASVTNTFWNGYSTVGLRSAWGTVNLGRQYVPAFTHIQNQIDPFGGDTVTGTRDVGMRPGAVAKVRVSDSIRYDFSAAGFNVAASIAERSQAGAAAGADRPFSVAGNYSAGPLFVGVGYEDPANVNDKLLSAGVRYAFGPATLSAGASTGRTATDAKTRGYLVGVNWTLGPGDLKAAYATNKTAGVTGAQRVGLGYHYNLSKRTKLYADLAHERKATANKSGYDLGIQHNF